MIAPVFLQDGPQHLVDVFIAAPDGLAQDAFLDRAQLAKRAVGASVLQRHARFEPMGADRTEGQRAGQARQIDLSWESAEWECTLAPSWRGTGAFLETARLVGSFAFGSVGVHRLEARVLLQNGRANGALRKLGAVQEGVLRESVRRGSTYLDQVLWSVLKEDWGEHWVSTAPRVH